MLEQILNRHRLAILAGPRRDPVPHAIVEAHAAARDLAGDQRASSPAPWSATRGRRSCRASTGADAGVVGQRARGDGGERAVGAADFDHRAGKHAIGDRALQDRTRRSQQESYACSCARPCGDSAAASSERDHAGGDGADQDVPGERDRRAPTRPRSSRSARRSCPQTCRARAPTARACRAGTRPAPAPTQTTARPGRHRAPIGS